MPAKFLLFILISISGLSSLANCPSKTLRIEGRRINADGLRGGAGVLGSYLTDPTAKTYFQKYEENKKIRSANTALGTIGSLFILIGLVKQGRFEEGGITSKASLISTGFFMLIINFLASKTLDHNNKYNLENAIREHNKRSTPQIKFGLLQDRPWEGRTPQQRLKIVFSREF